MTDRQRELTDLFAAADVETRRMLLLEFADGLPPLRDEYRLAMERGIGRVHECQTPVFLFASRRADDSLELHGFAPPESPTVRGALALLIEGLSGANPDAALATPDDLFQQMGLGEALGMVRQRGLAAVLARLKREVRQLAG
jgi:cysteine desulfuration protein SufE